VSTPPPKPRPKPTSTSAAAFVKACYAALNKVAVTADARPLSRFASASCKQCRDFVITTNALRRAHRHCDKGPFSVQAVTADVVRRNRTTSDANIRNPRRRVLDTRGRTVEQIASSGRVAGIRTWLSWTGGHWAITRSEQIW